MQHTPFRLLRTSLVGATALGLAAGAHLMAGGVLPAPPITAALLALHILCSTLATGFRLTLPTMVALLAGSQLILHQAFATLSHSASLELVHSTTMAAHHISAQELPALLLAQTGTANGPVSPAHAGAMSAGMWAAHIGATLAAAALLAHGENALWALANWLRPLCRCAAVVLVLPVRATRPATVPRTLRRIPWRNVRPDIRRGPPLRRAVFA